MTIPELDSASRIAHTIAAGQASSREITELILARTDRINPEVNAVVMRAADEALAEADRLDAARDSGRSDSGLSSSPGLAGLPITIKEAIGVKGWPLTWGNPDWRDARATSDAAVVRRLRAAGLVLAGQTNVAAMLGDFGQTTNSVYGSTRNPWDLSRATGGSSGGSAAAVACGMSYLDYGSDVVGSVRLPASFCGVYGLKPTPGLVPLAGFQPPGPKARPTLLDQMCALGPITRSATDLHAALRHTAGPTPPEARAFTWALPQPRHDHLREFRVGVVLDDPAAPVTSAVGDVLSEVTDAMASAGVGLRSGWPDDFDPRASRSTFDYLIGAYFAFKQGTAGDGPDLNQLVDVDHQQREIQAIWDDYFTDIDVLLCPTTVQTAPPHDDRPGEQRTLEDGRPYQDLAAWIPHASIAGLPALSAPVGLAADGLPVGLQVIGPRYEDDTVVRFAEELAALFPPPTTPELS